jgi:hypothetical protein
VVRRYSISAMPPQTYIHRQAEVVVSQLSEAIYTLCAFEAVADARREAKNTKSTFGSGRSRRDRAAERRRAVT